MQRKRLYKRTFNNIYSYSKINNIVCKCVIRSMVISEQCSDRGMRAKRSYCFFTYIILDLFRSHLSRYTSAKCYMGIDNMNTCISYLVSFLRFYFFIFSLLFERYVTDQEACIFFKFYYFGHLYNSKQL